MADREHVNNDTTESTKDCGVCGKAVAEGAPQYPFCSERCRKVDLGRWADGSYKVTRPIEERDLDQE